VAQEVRVPTYLNLIKKIGIRRIDLKGVALRVHSKVRVRFEERGRVTRLYKSLGHRQTKRVTRLKKIRILGFKPRLSLASRVFVKALNLSRSTSVSSL
jgi:hypothetical protein